MEGLLFTPLPSPQSRWKSFLTGWGVQSVCFVCLFFVSARFHETFIPAKDYRVTRIVSYEPLPITEQPQPVAPRVVARTKPVVQAKAIPDNKPVAEAKPALTAFVVTPQVRVAPQRKSVDAEPMAPSPTMNSKLPMIPPAPTSQVVAVGTFSHESPVTAPVAKLATVQAAGFGTGPGNSNGNGTGSGTGKGTGVPSVVASAGFGNGAIDTSSAPAHRKLPQLSGGSNAPVEIISKPKPSYTDEGRKQKINGEVRLEVLFQSDGRVHVVRVLQGLGYGLDEQAVKAAEQIKFKPALHDGQPTDATAMVHIIFELTS